MVIRDAFELTRLRWTRPILPFGNSAGESARRFPQRQSPATFPVITGGRVFFADAGRIFGYELRDGSPAFFDKNGTDTTSIPERATLYSLGENGPFLAPTEPTRGVPWFTLTTHDGRLYARLGSPVTGRARNEKRAERSSLVCLDLQRGEGKLVWKIDARTRGEGWEFEGAPVVTDDRLFVVQRRRHPETEIHVACYDAERGKPLWTTRIGTAIAAGEETANHISHLLLTVSAGRLYLATDMGALASLDACDGFLDWIVTYRSRNADRITEKKTAYTAHLSPCFLHHGLLFVAPSDTDRLLAVDAQTGQPLWQRALRGGVQHLLGVSQGRLIVSGKRLWGLDPQRGSVVWNLGYENPAGYGFGRGLLAGDRVYWPLHKEVLVVAAKSGRMTGRIKLSESFGRGGGNLMFADGTLLIASPRRLTAYSTDPVRRK